jgi:hypothetical protein
MVVRYIDFPAGERLRPVDGRLTTPPTVSHTRSDSENVGPGHLNIDNVAHDGERSNSERGRLIVRLPVRTHVDCWSCAMKGDQVSIAVTAERLFTVADISSVPMAVRHATDVESNSTPSIATGRSCRTSRWISCPHRIP